MPRRTACARPSAGDYAFNRADCRNRIGVSGRRSAGGVDGMTRRPLGPRPNPLPLSNRVLSFFFQAPAFFLSTAFFGSLSLVASLFEEDGKLQHRIAQAWARTSVSVSGCPVTVLGKENLQKHPVAVYACNHLSYMDTPVIFSSLPFQFRIVARHDLWKLPFIGWHLRRSGQVPVNVDNPRASISSLSSAV